MKLFFSDPLDTHFKFFKYNKSAKPFGTKQNFNDLNQTCRIWPQNYIFRILTCKLFRICPDSDPQHCQNLFLHMVLGNTVITEERR